jgi:hypothetical protein
MNAGRLGVLVICLVAVTALGGGSLLAEPVDAQPESLLLQQIDLETDTVRIGIDLHEDGSATWTIEFWSALENENRTAAFESLQDDIQANPGNYTGSFADSINGTVDAARQSTGREMTASNFTVSTERQTLGREYGVVRYSFEWTGFARVEGNQLHAGDAIEGLYLDDGTRLLISWPAEYEPQSVSPNPDDRRDTAAIWQGANTEFVDGEPRVVVAPSGIGLGPVAGVLGVLVVLAGLGGWLYRRQSTEAVSDGASTANVDVTAAEPATESTDPPAASTDAADDTIAETDNTAGAESTAAGSADSGNADSDADSSAATEPDESLLSNEEQVMQLLEANGGRMKQQTVVEELDWTDAKTSKVVSGMREDGTIESFRIGRENVLTTPEDDLGEVDD